MGWLSKPSAPPAPDYNAAAVTQGQEARNTAEFNTALNRVNQVGPGGSITWTQTPGVNGAASTWTQTTALDPATNHLRAQGQTLDATRNDLVALGLDRAAHGGIDTSGMGSYTSSVTPGAMPAGPVLDTHTIDKVNAGGVRTSFDTSGVRALPGQIDDTSRRRVEEALLSRLNPQYEADQRALQTRLANSGISVGTDAYNREQDTFARRLNDARMAAVLTGGQEENRQIGLAQGLQAQEFGQAEAKGKFGQTGDFQSGQLANQAGEINARTELEQQRLQNEGQFKLYDAMLKTQGQSFDQGVTNAGLNNSVRGDVFKEAAFNRELPIQELNQLRPWTATPGTDPGLPNYYTGGQAGPTPIMDATIAGGNYANAQYQQQQSGYNGMLGGLANLGAAYFMSDARLKVNIHTVGSHPSGIRRVAWDWKSGGTGLGVIAQELATIRPDAVLLGNDGFLRVNYSAIGGF